MTADWAQIGSVGDLPVGSGGRVGVWTSGALLEVIE